MAHKKRLTLLQARAVIKRAGFNSGDLITLAMGEIGDELKKVSIEMQKNFGKEEKQIELSFNKFIQTIGKPGYEIVRTLVALDDLNESATKSESLQGFRVFIPDLKRFVEALDKKDKDEQVTS